jgi:uncharacterized membrane protein YqjE
MSETAETEVKVLGMKGLAVIFLLTAVVVLVIIAAINPDARVYVTEIVKIILGAVTALVK